MSGTDQERGRHLVRQMSQRGACRSAARAAFEKLAAEGRLTGDDRHDVDAMLSLLAPAPDTRRKQGGSWMRRDDWTAGQPLVHLDLHCLAEEGLAESWVVPAPEAALVAANWALRLAIAPDHDDLNGKLNVHGPLALWDGYVKFATADSGEQSSAWAWDLDPHSREGGWCLRSNFVGIDDALRRRLSRRTGPVLVEPRAGKALTVTEELRRWDWGELRLDVDPDSPISDRVGVGVSALVDDDLCNDVWDDFMDGVRSVGEWVSRAYGGPGSGRDEETFGPPVPGRIDFTWHTFPASLLREVADDEVTT